MKTGYETFLEKICAELHATIVARNSTILEQQAKIENLQRDLSNFNTILPDERPERSHSGLWLRVSCDQCLHKHWKKDEEYSYEDEGWCYMFKDHPNGFCAQFKRIEKN
jgi:alkylated DNA repair dioxygenase AlkB